MGVPFNAVNQVYQLGFPEFAWGNDAYLPGNIQRVGHWVQPRKFGCDAVTSVTANEPVTKFLELLEKTTSD
jgi:hypothetical protein